MSALLKIERVNVSLGGASVLTDISLSVGAGEIVALLGANGAGKTTLIRASLGLVRPNAGSVSLGGAAPASLTARTRALRVAYLPQRPQAAWPIPVADLVALGRFAHGAAPERLGPRDQAAVDAALDACGLTALRRRRMDEISGGERMRVHVARTLAQGAPLLMLDEPTAGLDPAQSLDVSDILSRHAANAGAVIFATHDIALAARTATRVLLLKSGRTLSEGSPSEALTEKAIEAAYNRKGRMERVGAGIVAVFE